MHAISRPSRWTQALCSSSWPRLSFSPSAPPASPALRPLRAADAKRNNARRSSSAQPCPARRAYGGRLAGRHRGPQIQAQTAPSTRCFAVALRVPGRTNRTALPPARLEHGRSNTPRAYHRCGPSSQRENTSWATCFPRPSYCRACSRNGAMSIPAALRATAWPINHCSIRVASTSRWNCSASA